MIPICVIHPGPIDDTRGCRGGIYIVNPNITVDQWLTHIADTEAAQGRPITDWFGVKLEFGSARPAFIGGLDSPLN